MYNGIISIHRHRINKDYNLPTSKLCESSIHNSKIAVIASRTLNNSLFWTSFNSSGDFNLVSLSPSPSVKVNPKNFEYF